MIRNIQKSIVSQRVRAFMRVLFGLFLFLYFYFLQFPLLELVQYQLSEGRTTYHRLISSLVLTIVLIGLQRLVTNWIRFSESAYFFSYLPSVVLAILLTAFTPSVNRLALTFVGVALVAFVAAAVYSVKRKSLLACDNSSYAKLLTTHAVGMIGVLFSLGAFSNSDDIITFENKAAHYIRCADYEQALHIGERSLASSNRLTALRAYALAHTKRGMGESLFSYPLPHTGAEQLLFMPEDTLAQLLPPDSLYLKLGAWKSSKESASDFFRRASLKNDSSNFVRDYWLSALLLEKELGRFTAVLPTYYPIGDSVRLPRFYQEALFMYAFEQSQSLNWPIDSLLKKSYYEFKVQEGLYSDSLVRENQLRRKYGNTYWWYYHYQH